MDKVMHGEKKRSGGNTLYGVLSAQWLSCLILLFSAMLPGYSGAADWDTMATGCTDWNGQPATVWVKLPPSISFVSGQSPAPGSVLYTSPEWHQINYKCKIDSNYSARPTLLRLADALPLFDQALSDAGLKLQILIEGVSQPWEPKIYSKVNFGPYYKKSTGNQTLKFKIRLVVEKQSTSGFSAVPSLTAFKVIANNNAIASPGLFLATQAIRIQYVPTCFVNTSLPKNNVDFGPVITTDVDNSFSRSLPFTVRAEVNTGCNGGNLGNLRDPYKIFVNGQLKGTYYLELPLKVSFLLNNGGIISGDKQSIILNNTDGKKNGLKLKIFDGSNSPVTFGEIILPESSPANKFGEFNGESNTWNVSNTYNAVLSSTGDPVVIGKYRAQVTVKVEYY